MQLLLVSKSKVFLKWVFSHIWILVKRIVKNPLGFIWWAFKMYIALMLLMFCILMSFGAIAQVFGNDPTIDYEAGYYAPQGGDITECKTTAGGVLVKWTIDGKRYPADCNASAMKKYTASELMYVNRTAQCKPKITQTLPDGSVMYQRYIWLTSPEFSGCATYGNVLAFSHGGEFSNWLTTKNCPPQLTGSAMEDAKRAAYRTKSEITLNGTATTQCFKLKPKPTNCPKATDPDIAPIKHFDTSATSDKICVKNDSGELCPFKKVSLGVFVPDTSDPDQCTVGDIPETQEPPPIDCKDMGSGQKACRADPNQKCKVTQGGKQECDQKCGYVNKVFMCIEGEPTNTPLAPLKTPDDSVTDPTTKTPDMDKQDHKDIMKGAEDRLDNVVTGLQNLGKQLSDQKTDGPTKSGQDRSNMYLSSIDKNVAEINKKLDGGKDDEEDIPLNPKELDFEHNDFETRNFGTVIDTAAKSLLGKPIFMSIKSYFNASFGGSCPTWSVDVDVYTITIDQLCSETMNQVWPGIRAIIILVFSFLAFRVAFLD